MGAREELAADRESLAKVKPDYERLMRSDRLLESRRAGDVKVRMTAFADGCDVLIVPRYTVMKLARGSAIRLLCLTCSECCLLGKRPLWIRAT